jgi:hypothetical protein
VVCLDPIRLWNIFTLDTTHLQLEFPSLHATLTPDLRYLDRCHVFAWWKVETDGITASTLYRTHSNFISAGLSTIVIPDNW